MTPDTELTRRNYVDLLAEVVRLLEENTDLRNSHAAVVFEAHTRLAEQREEIKRLSELNEDLTKSIGQYANRLDVYIGTPCEQIRHLQEVESLREVLEPFAKECARQERVRSYRDGDCLVVDSRLTIGDLRRTSIAFYGVKAAV